MIFQHPVQLLSYPSHDKFMYLRVYALHINIVSHINIYQISSYIKQYVTPTDSFFSNLLILFVKIDSLPGTEEALMEEGEESEKASGLTAPVSIFIDLILSLKRMFIPNRNI